MASRWWVGGSGTWDTATTTNWSASNGGPGGASNPTAADDVFVNGSSGSPTITIDTATIPLCRSLDTTGATCSFNWQNLGTSHLKIGDASGGAVTFSATTTHTNLAGNTNGLQLVSTSTNGGVGWGITTNGITLPTITISGSGKYVLQDNLTYTTNGTGLLALLGGTLDTNGKTVNGWGFSSTGAVVRSLILTGLTTWNLSATSGTIWNVTGSNVTVTPGGSTINVTAAATATRTFAGLGLTYNNLSYTVANSPGILAITGANTFNTVTVNSAKNLQLPASVTNTITTFNVNGVNNGYLYLPAVASNNASAPDSAALSITGDLDLRVDLAFDTLTPAATQFIIAKDEGNTNRSYSFRITSSGTINFLNSALGTTASSISSSVTLASVGYTNGQRLTVRVTYRNSDGRLQFWHGTGGVNGTFTQLGANATATILGIFDSTAVLALGTTSNGGSALAAKFYRAQIRNNILDDGTGIQFDSDFTTKTVGANTFTETSTNAATVTINGVLAQAGDGRVAITSSAAGTAATCSFLSQVNSDYLTVQDNTASTTTPAYAGAHGTLVSGTTNWLATAAPGGSTLLMMGI